LCHNAAACYRAQAGQGFRASGKSQNTRNGSALDSEAEVLDRSSPSVLSGKIYIQLMDEIFT
jgi:hypothetical protein